MVIGEIADQDAAEMPLVEDKHVIEALAPDGAEEPACDLEEVGAEA
jgi:hypothetical protein